MGKTLRFLVLLNYLLLNSTYQISAQLPNTWAQKGNFSSMERSGAVSFGIGAKGYMGTGKATANTKDFWEYNPLTDTWSQKADFGGTARMNATGFSIADKGYIACGDDGSYKNDFWEYNPSTNTWMQKADFAGEPRVGAVGFCLGSKGYLGTGLLLFSPPLRTNDFWEYDPAIDVWIQKSNVGGFARAFGVGFTIGNIGYIGTGQNGSSVQKDFWSYNPINGIWIQKADFGGVGRFQAVGIGAVTYGYIGLGNTGGSYTNDFWLYNPALDTWTQKTSFGGPARTLASGFSISDRIFVGTGYYVIKAVKYKDFWEYTTTCNIPVIVSEPVNQSITYGESAGFNVIATGVVTYQWQENAGSGFVDLIDGGIYSNAKTASLAITFPGVVMNGFKYRCILTGNCLSAIATTAPATLVLTNVSTNEVSAELFDVYPNPSHGVINIKLNIKSNASYNIEIFNSVGAITWKLNNANLDGNTIKIIDLSDLKSGLYSVVLRNKVNTFIRRVYIIK